MTAKNRNSSPVGPLPIFCLRPTPVLHKSIVFIMPKPCCFLGGWPLFMQTNVSYGNVLFVHVNRSLSKQKFSGPQHHFKQVCGTASFVDMSSLTTLAQQAEAGGRNEKNLHKRKRGSLFSGRTHAGSLFLTNFVGLDIFNSPESVPHRHFYFHAEALIKYHVPIDVNFPFCYHGSIFRGCSSPG